MCSERCLFYAVITYYLYGGQLQPALGCSFLPFIEDHRVALGCCFHLRSEGCVLDVFPISSLYSIPWLFTMVDHFFKTDYSMENQWYLVTDLGTVWTPPLPFRRKFWQKPMTPFLENPGSAVNLCVAILETLSLGAGN